ncbi:YCF48-related protein [Algoriphagus sp. PAP.12]|uniref:YCF48-related protein n=1 Tax=Algoriphagus sp. PAP.12 TaxID=2996678 RepID=UPI00227A4A7D|nr:YCF48-related protein [Algoriphagus sp. PAP.12]
MRKLSILFSLFFLIPLGTFGQTWTRLQSWGLDLEAIVWVNDSVAFAGGENLLIKTSDYGQSWQELPIEFEGRIQGLQFEDADSGIAVGENSLILQTQDGGASWNSISLSGDFNWKDIAYNGNAKWLMVGKSGDIYQSIDDGSSWQKVESGVNEGLNSINFLNQDTVYSSGEKGTILRSYNGGDTWEKLNSGISTDLNDIQFSSDLIGYAVGEGGIAIKTVDGGETWQSLVTGVVSDLNSLSLSKLNSSILVAAGETATIIKSGNAGVSFSKINLGATNSRGLREISFVGQTNQVFGVGVDGYGISSSNAGSSFSQKLAGYRNDFSAIDFKSDRIGFVAGQKGQFLITTNYGQSFVSRPIPEEIDIAAIDFWNTSFGYVSGPAGKIYRTSNSGVDWGDFSINTNERVDGFYLFAPSVLYLAGTGGFITRSSDSGVTWDLNIDSATPNDLKDLMFFDYAEGIAIGSNGEILYSYGGTNWEKVESLTSENFNALAKVSGFSAVMVGDNGIIVKTDDMAKSFEVIDSGTAQDLLSVDFFDEKYGFVSGVGGITLVTKDGGNSWTQIESGTSRDLVSVSATSPTMAYAAGNDGSILVYNCNPAEGVLSEISGLTQSCLEIQKYSITDGIIPGTQLNWRVDGGDIISGQGTNTIEVNWKDVGRRGVFVDRRNFCGAGETSYIEVIVSDMPAPEEVIAGNGIVCQGNEETYTMPELEGVSYSWTIDGGEIIDGQGTANMTVIWNTSGSGIITVTPENSCGKSETISLPITITPLPSQPSEIEGESLVAFGEQVYSVVMEEGIGYQWMLSGGGTIISGQGTSSIQVVWEEEGDYVLQVKSQNSCDDGPESNLNVKVSLITGIEPSPDLEGLKVYPNPSHGRFVVEAEFLDQWSEASLINGFGQVLLQSDIRSGQKKIEFSNLKAGVFYLRLEGQKGSVVKKVIVQ